MLVAALAYSSPAFAGPITLAQAIATDGMGRIIRSGPTHADAKMVRDNSSTTWIKVADVSANTSYGLHDATLDQLMGVKQGPQYVPPTAVWDFGLNYTLQATSTGSSPLTLASTSLTQSVVAATGQNVIVDRALTGSFEFTYGTAYNFASELRLASGGSGVGGTAASIWNDTFTFLGGAPGTTGIAELELGLVGSFFAETFVAEDAKPVLGFGGVGPWTVSHGRADFSDGVILRFIRLAGDTTLETASGTAYAVQRVPEPSTALLLALGLGDCRD